MSVGNWVAGAGGYAGVLAAVVATLLVSARVTARLVGARDFRWFAPTRSASPLRGGVVRLVAVVAPWLIPAALFWTSLTLYGLPSTNKNGTVEVLDGAARDAGMHTGDRIVRIGEQEIHDFEAVRQVVQRQQGACIVKVERDGHHIELTLTPRHGKIGVAPLATQAAVGAFAAAKLAFSYPLRTLSAGVHSLIDAVSPPDFRGPAGIVQTASTLSQGGAYLSYLGLLATYAWCWAGSVVVVEVLTFWIFQASSRRSAAAASTDDQRYLARLRQALLICLVGKLLFGGAWLLTRLEVPGALALMLLATPFAAAGVALVWLAGKCSWGCRWSGLALAASLLVPGAQIVASVLLLLRLRKLVTP